MQHLEDTHRFPDITVTRVIKRDYYNTENCTFDKFVSFPARAGYELKENYTLIRTGIIDLSGAFESLEQEQLLQSWLFFGLIYTVVHCENGPILRYNDLLTGQPAPNDFIITTKELNGALKKWQDFMDEQARTNKDSAKLHMMRVEFVLQLARSVVKANCAADGLGAGHGGSGVKDLGPLHLSLMILGETLASAKSLILDKSPILNISGWHSEDADEGWGPSRTIYRKFQADAWCPRTVSVLRSQLKSNATLMYAAYLSYNGSEHKSAHADYISRARDEDKCTADVCKFKSETIDTREYVTNAMQRDHDHSQCRMIGPNMEEIINILAGRDNPDVIPLLDVFANPQENNQLEFKVKRFDCRDIGRQPKYAAISHVWSDGWGNPQENKLWTCQVRFIYDMLERGSALASRTDGGRRIESPSHQLFWMDTLVIPVTKDQQVIRAVRNHRQDAKEVKKRALRQIYNVFSRSDFTIIIDNGLSYLTRNDDAPCQTAMRILASGWMKRLWTLQEAYLSERLYVAFNNHGGDFQPMTDFRTLVEVDLNSKSGVIASTKRHLTESIMFAERIGTRPGNGRKHHLIQGMENAQEGYRLMVGAWRAARFRTTSNPADEMRALATLLHLPFEETRIDEAGLTQNAQTDEELNILAQHFWDLFQKKYPRSIPPGFIFLPGKRLGIKGYGWAPQTFLSVFETGYPDPLPPPVGIFRGTELHKPTGAEQRFGLRVQYPGFLLHCRNGITIREKILGPDNMQDLLNESVLTFPANASLLDWYQVRPSDNIVDLPSSIKDHRTQLAIILARPDPKEKPKEIGLLVEIYKRVQAEHDRSRTAFCCQIIRRVLVNRYSRPNMGDEAEVQQPHLLRLLPKNLFPPEGNEEDDTLCIGETVDADQEWFVDGFQPSRESDLSEYERGSSDPPDDDLDTNSIATPENLNHSMLGRMQQSWMRSGFSTFFRGLNPATPTAAPAQPSPSLLRVRTLGPKLQTEPPSGPPRRATTLGYLY